MVSGAHLALADWWVEGGGGGGSKVKVEDSLVVGWFQSQVQSRIQECNVDVAPQ